jgi:AcrR family transcriptional regulator
MDAGKRDKILAAALDVFLRYGYKRVTMNDIAEGAGISRPALYLVFDSKEAIFRSVYGHWVAGTLTEIEGAIGRLKTPGEKLRAAFELWTVLPFERMRTSSEAEELLECTFGFAQEAVNQGYRSFEKMIVPVLKSHARFHSPKPRVSAEKTAQVLSGAVRGFKSVAKDVSEIRSLIRGLLILLLDE